MPQYTIKAPVAVSGIGLHSGQPCSVQLRPAAVDTGVRFVDESGQGEGPIAADVRLVTGTRLATTLTDAGWSVQTVEHLLSAVCGMGVDNLEVAVDGPEVPLMDGTAGAWAQALRDAQLVDQGVPRTVLVIDRTVRVEQGKSWVQADPADRLRLELTIDFDHPMVGQQSFSWDGSTAAFEADLAWARTFGFERDVAALQRMGLIAGGSLDNAVVFSKEGVLNEGGLHQPDEPVRHKAMDMLGDLALAGHRMRGHFSGHRPGHGSVIALVQALLADEDAWHLEKEPMQP